MRPCVIGDVPLKQVRHSRCGTLFLPFSAGIATLANIRCPVLSDLSGLIDSDHSVFANHRLSARRSSPATDPILEDECFFPRQLNPDAKPRDLRIPNYVTPVSWERSINDAFRDLLSFHTKHALLHFADHLLTTKEETQCIVQKQNMSIKL